MDQKLRNSSIVAAVVFLFAPSPSVQAQDLPEGAGKEIVMRVCTVCHDPEHFTSKRRTKEEWNETVDKMAQRGAMATDEEFDTIVAYLAKNFGKDKTAK